MHAYLITDPAYYGSTPDELCKRLKTVLSRHRPDFICYRDKSHGDYPAMAERFLACATTSGHARLLLHGDVALARRLGAFGVHLTSMQFNEIETAKAAGLYVVVSTHSETQMEEAVQKGADAVTYSPVYHSPGKGNPKGLEDLKERVDKIGIPVFALGGIVTPAQVKEVEAAGCYGFASIRYFIEN